MSTVEVNPCPVTLLMNCFNCILVTLETSTESIFDLSCSSHGEHPFWFENDEPSEYKWPKLKLHVSYYKTKCTIYITMSNIFAKDI